MSNRRNKQTKPATQTQQASAQMTEQTQQPETPVVQTESNEQPETQQPEVQTEETVQGDTAEQSPAAETNSTDPAAEEPEETVQLQPTSEFSATEAILKQEPADTKPQANSTTEVKGFTISKPQTPEVNNPDVYSFIKHKYFYDLEQYPTSLKVTIKGVEDYIKTMNSRAPVTPEIGARAQSRFVQTICASLENKNSGEAIMCFDALLFMVNRNTTDVFNERLTGRFYNRLPLPAQQQLLKLMNLLLLTASPATRTAGLTKTRLEEVLVCLTSNTQKQNMAAFYAKNSN